MRVVSYCIAVKDRSQELKDTLSVNLAENLMFCDKIQFVVNVIDDDDGLIDYLNDNYAAEVLSGYLKINAVTDFGGWHFGRAKNSFKNDIDGALYSSLDADNFVGSEETRQILDVFDELGCGFLFHHFSGTWGDGTCGRVTMSTDRYRSVGYDEHFFSRQFDEYDLIVSCLRTDPDLKYVSYLPGGGLLKSKQISEYLEQEGIELDEIVVPDYRQRMPLNSKDADYARQNATTAAMGMCNAALSFGKNSCSASAREKYSAKATSAANQVLDTLEPIDVLPAFFGPIKCSTIGSMEGRIPVFSCIKDDLDLIQAWYQHYKKLGCGPFFIVDDKSALSISKFLPYPDVHILSPAVGTYRTFKSVWIKAAMKAFLSEGQWAVTIDADEFVDIPKELGGTVQSLVSNAEARASNAFPGILIDMLPSKPIGSIPLDQKAIIETFSDHYFEKRPDDETYNSHPAVKWAFGEHWRASFCIDARYKIFETIDVLRKVPLVKFRSDVILNQGFHDVGFSDQKGMSHKYWGGGLVLPIRHYKLVKLFDVDERSRMREQSQAPMLYHPRTSKNMADMLSIEQTILSSRIRLISTIRYDPSSLVLRLHLAGKAKTPRRMGAIGRLRTVLGRPFRNILRVALVVSVAAADSFQWTAVIWA